MSRYNSTYGDGDVQKRYHGYVLANEGTENQWPGEFWSPVYPPWGTDSVSESMLRDWLEENYPNQSWAIQEVVWIAEPTKWTESNGSTTYLGSGWQLPRY